MLSSLVLFVFCWQEPYITLTSCSTWFSYAQNDIIYNDNQHSCHGEMRWEKNPPGLMSELSKISSHYLLVNFLERRDYTLRLLTYSVGLGQTRSWYSETGFPQANSSLVKLSYLKLLGHLLNGKQSTCKAYVWTWFSVFITSSQLWPGYVLVEFRDYCLAWSITSRSVSMRFLIVRVWFLSRIDGGAHASNGSCFYHVDTSASPDQLTLESLNY